MKVLVVGGGGREHALVWKIKQSPKVTKVYCAPGNAGMAQIAECVAISVEDIDGLLNFAQQEGIDMTVVGPEAPLTMGLVDKFRVAGLKVFGPSRQAAELEGSKVMAKELMSKYNIPTAKYAKFTDAGSAIEYIKETGAPCVVKADGLAAGKGVVVARDEETAINAVRMMMEDKAFGQAGDMIIIEECLEGEEVSILAFTDGETVVPMVSSQDHKRVFDNDEGPNTGGMGAYSPAPVYTDELHRQVMEKILKPTMQGMAQEGRLYEGVLYAGLMITKDGPKVLEFNVRFGDPETQAVLTRLDSDLVEIMEAVIDKRLHEVNIRWKPEAAVCVVLAAGGYPGSYKKGDPITGLDDAAREAIVFHAGTGLQDGRIVTSGGRVLGVTALGPSIPAAIENAYKAVGKIHFDNMHYRKDIGQKALRHL
ncbi:phosphoribosylamine/glycine ligase [Thermincola ferriacetica]|uniref:Phosphoribosylamine--glycine ligase n=1 Tax=Thermincola ferriacetica TaxID=281456 RepID=A0A0L6W0K1_9FIRM|nr:phosphoribosylamine--glycine ligase [Thermincola ferriacetica]KNZ69060.1 phosphoribosylamine/glycine ligase [Thermincola ferriacetica]